MNAPADTLERQDAGIPAYVDIARLCHELSITERTADAWVRQGILPAPRQRGGKRLWKWKEVQSSIDDGAPTAPASADTQAEGISHATRQLAEEAAENRRGHVRRRDPGLSGEPDVREARAGDKKELSRVAGDG